MQNGLLEAETFSTLQESNLSRHSRPTHNDLPWPLSHEFVTNDLPKKKVYESSYLTTLNQFFACTIVIFGLLKLNIKAMHDIPESLTASWGYWAAHLPQESENWAWNLGQIFKIKLCMFGE